jgi:hypothetical protein
VLPFVQAPAPVQKRRIGTPTTGIIEMPILGGLTVDESDTITDLLADAPAPLVPVAKLSDAIATAEEITISEAFQLIQDSLAGANLEPAANAIRLKYADRIEAMAKTVSASTRLSTVATVTALIRHRLDRPTWSLAETRKLPGPLLEGIYRLSLDEQAAEDLPSAPHTDEDLKKPHPEPSPTSKRRGTRSSGS